MPTSRSRARATGSRALSSESCRALSEGSFAGSAAGLASLGIDPQSWVSHPRIVGTATVDIYSGKRDSALRRLTIDTTLPVHRSLASRLGGMSSAALALSIDYSHLGEPQTISARAYAESDRVLQSRLQALSAGIGTSASEPPPPPARPHRSS